MLQDRSPCSMLLLPSESGAEDMTPQSDYDADELLTEGESAEFLKVSTRTLQAWRCNNSGPPFARVGRSIRYRRADLRHWLSSRTVSN
jgi:hypothetical protein